MSELTLEGFKIGLCQQPCIPSNPVANAQEFVRSIEQAEADELDLLVGVEGMQGYLIGDQYEYTAFLTEVDAANETIRQATEGKRVAVAYGSVLPETHTSSAGAGVQQAWVWRRP
jgi:predicted amidohydrolase